MHKRTLMFFIRRMQDGIKGGFLFGSRSIQYRLLKMHIWIDKSRRVRTWNVLLKSYRDESESIDTNAGTKRFFQVQATCRNKSRLDCIDVLARCNERTTLKNAL